MKIGIYGGTFNPIHAGHLHILAAFYERLGLDKVLLIPTKRPPHKAAADLACEADRLEMCRLALAGLPLNGEVSDIEIRRRGKSYTADTLLELKKKYPGDELFLLMGEDMFLTIDQWARPQVIFRSAVVCGSPRSADGYRRMLSHARELKAKYPDYRYIVEDIPYMEAASTAIRKGEADELLPGPVAQYIREKGLYGRSSE